MTRSAGHCNPMGTASTMASMVEALGLTLPDNAAIPAPDARRRRLAHLTGRRIVEMVRDDLKPSADPDPRRVRERHPGARRHRRLDATPSSTSWRSPAGSASTSTLDDFDRIGSHLPLLANVMPAGEFLMEDFFEAGGIPAVMAELDGAARR